MIGMDGPVEIGIQKADRRPTTSQGHRQVKGDGRLSDTLFTGAHQHHVLHARQQLPLRPTSGGGAPSRPPSDLQRFDPLQGLHGPLNIGFDLGLEGTGGRGELHQEMDSARLDLEDP